MREAFDYANGRTFSGGVLLPLLNWRGDLAVLSVHFVEQTLDRLWGRLLHVFMFKDIEQSFAELRRFEQRSEQDKSIEVPRQRDRLEEFLGLIDTSAQPFFGHMHLMDSHGPWYRPRQPVFSAGQEQPAPWYPGSHYDDVIREFDQNLERLVSHLKARGKFEHTILVFTTDHGNNYRTDVRLPLVLCVPGGEGARIAQNVQLLDLAPTLLKLLKIEPPAWLEGRSVVSGSLDPLYPIVSVNRYYDQEIQADPHHRLGFLEHTSVSLLVCDQMLTIDLDTATVSLNNITGHTAKCQENSPPAKEQRLQDLLRRLREAGVTLPPLKWK
jgi:hypothetical protein